MWFMDWSCLICLQSSIPSISLHKNVTDYQVRKFFLSQLQMLLFHFLLPEFHICLLEFGEVLSDLLIVICYKIVTPSVIYFFQALLVQKWPSITSVIQLLLQLFQYHRPGLEFLANRCPSKCACPFLSRTTEAVPLPIRSQKKLPPYVPLQNVLPGISRFQIRF